MTFDEETQISAKDLSKLLGLSERRLRQLVEEGEIKRPERGKYLLFEAVQTYISRIKKQSGQFADLDKEKTQADIRLKQAKAEYEELELKELKGELHRSEDVAAMTEDLIYAIRSSLLALPGRLAMDMVGVGTAAEAANKMQTEIYKIMQELGNYKYDPKKYEERMRQRMNWNESEGSADDE